ITGPPDAAALARYQRAGSELRFAGDLSDAHLVAGYRAAIAYVHPALVEGFGLPMLEATVAGTPVVASGTAVPALVAPYATTFAPHDTLALRATLTDLVANPAPYRRRAAEGRDAVRAYTWDRFAAATAAVYREVANGTSRA
ncbi:MAG TPA: glycosyltransferase, partial [Candidatus Lustribacter sp.]|nr:glycosyltransferase [Candidatus Lustribacter sp.]